MNKRWDDSAWLDYIEWQNEDRKTLKKINNLIKDIERNGVDKGIGKPEPLKYEYAGSWSRRIDEKNRLIYEVDSNGYLYIISCKDHYSK